MRLSNRVRRRRGDHRPQEPSPSSHRAESSPAPDQSAEAPAPPFVASRHAGAWDLVERSGAADGSGEAVRFVGDVRATLERMAAVTVDFGIGSARASLAASVTGGELERMREGLEAVVATMSALREASKDTADSSTASAELAEQLAAETETGLATLGSVIDAIGVMKDQGDGVTALVERLATELNNIGAISSIIDGVARQTKLLALNAAIEAARAGEHGRGFAVVADEVGRLAADTASQTAQIAQTIEATRRELGAVQVATRQSSERAQASVQDAAHARSALERMRELVHRSTEPTAQVAAAAQEQLAELESVAGHLDEAAGAAGTIEEQARAVREQTRELSAKTEDASEALGRFEIGSFLDRVYRLAAGLSVELGAILEDAVDSGRVTLTQVLALNYEEIRGPEIRRLARLFDVSRASASGFEPPKFHTAYDELVDEAMMAVMDRCLVEESRLEFALPIDLNSYAPAHNRRYTQAITGDAARDLAANRTKRFFLDSDALRRGARMDLPPTLPARVLTRAEIERAGAKLTRPQGDERRFLLQTYARDTGALLSVVTVPLYVKDQRYGSVIVGWNPAE